MDSNNYRTEKNIFDSNSVRSAGSAELLYSAGIVFFLEETSVLKVLIVLVSDLVFLGSLSSRDDIFIVFTTA